MENWLRAMELPESRVSPDIETYESVIQAWIRTGTQDGLMKAEALGNRLIEGTGASLQPRVQTFHPILSAWIYSSVDGAPEKVAEWLDRLDDLPDMVMDGRLLAAPIKVCIADQRRLLEPWKSCEKHLDASKTKDEVIKRAKQSSLCLAELVERLKHDSDFFLEADAFTLAIQAWYNASVLNAGDSSQGQYDFLLVEAQDIVRDFNDLIALLSSSAELPGRESRARQVRHLVESSPRVYSGAILCLRKCQELELESRPSNSHPQARQAVEKMFSRFTELRAMDPLTKNVENSRLPVAMIDQQYRKSSNDDCSDWMLYDDMFHYSSLPFLDKSLAETRIELLSQLFHLAEVSESLFEHDGDLVELCAGAAESLVYREMRESKPPSVGTSPEYINLLKEVRKTHLGKTYVILERLIRDLETNTKERARRMKN